MSSEQTRPWALILGASSGFGAASAIELARSGYDILGVHYDQRAALAEAQRVQDEIRQAGAQTVFLNENAGEHATIELVLNTLRQHAASEAPVRVLLHSIAFGTLKRFVGGSPSERLSKRGAEITMHLMANSLVYWAQALVESGMMGRGGRIYAMTSSGSHRAWHSYGAVSAAKAALESHVRQLALELAPVGITANAIQAGVTDTPALRKIPTHQEMIEFAQRINPHGRLTTPHDVARALVVLADDRTAWITGNTIRIDGGEDIVA